jgi:hypothetical protein
MGRRVTIMLDDDIDKNIRSIQAKKMESTLRFVSFSSVINEILRNNLNK